LTSLAFQEDKVAEILSKTLPKVFLVTQESNKGMPRYFHCIGEMTYISELADVSDEIQKGQHKTLIYFHLFLTRSSPKINKSHLAHLSLDIEASVSNRTSSTNDK
jgi:hypothetical protein